MSWKTDKELEENPRAMLAWCIQTAIGGKYVTVDTEGKREIKTLSDKMTGWMQRLDDPPVRVRLHSGFGWFSDKEWHQTPEKCFAEAEQQDIVIAFGECGKIYTSRAGMVEVVLRTGLEQGTIGWKQTTPTCRKQECYRTHQLTDGTSFLDWWAAHHFFAGGQEQQGV